MMQPQFVADVHLGKLARLLRMLGFDTLYASNYNNQQLEIIALQQQRILLSKNTAFARNQQLKLLIILSDDAYLQMQQVLQHFNLLQQLKPFTHCIVCNGVISVVDKQNVEHLLPENTRKNFDEFWQCNNCKRVYWKGSHYERMQLMIASLQ